MQKRTLLFTATAAAIVASSVAAVGSAGAWGHGDPEMVPRGAYDTGVEAGSEIVAYDAWRRQMVVTNGATNQIDIINVRDVDNPTLVRSIDLDPYGRGVQSVATSDWWIAAAIEGHDQRDNGTVVLIHPFGGVKHTFEVGNLPDSLAFSANGRYLVVANEAEPICGTVVDGVATIDKEGGEELLVDPVGSISIIDTLRKRVDTADFSAWIGKEDQLRSQGVRLYFPGSNAAQDLEPEYVTVSGNSTAYVTLQENNAVAVVDLRRAKVTKILPLGYKDHSLPGNGLDPSNEDGAELFAGYDVLGMYQPDAIATTNVGRKSYFVTANEGDSREWGCFSEDSRVKDFGLGGGYAEELEADELLGRLKTTSAFPTSFDAEGKIDQVYSYGARSFSIWDERGRQVFDSGDDFEEFLEGTPFFNLDEDETDQRSDDKGAEPEALAVGTIGWKTYAFVGLERSGGIMMYDITYPHRAEFVQYLNTADLGDAAPEGIAFVPAWQSPTWKPLLLVSFEVSGTTRVIELT